MPFFSENGVCVWNCRNARCPPSETRSRKKHGESQKNGSSGAFGALAPEILGLNFGARN